MSMISSQIDELRKMADGQATYRDARAVMLQAADTIWQLRDDLQQANDENAKLRTQLADVTESMGRMEERCAKLRELVADMWFWHYEGHIDSESQERQMLHIDAVIQRMRELGVEL